MRIRRTLGKYQTAEDILALLKDLQIKHNSKPASSVPEEIIAQNTRMMEMMTSKIEALTKEVQELKKSNQSVPKPSEKSQNSVALQADPKEIVGIVNSKHVKLPKIFKSHRKLDVSDEESKGEHDE